MLGYWLWDLVDCMGYIAQTLPMKPKSPLQRYRLLRKGKDVLA